MHQDFIFPQITSAAAQIHRGRRPNRDRGQACAAGWYSAQETTVQYWEWSQECSWEVLGQGGIGLDWILCWKGA